MSNGLAILSDGAPLGQNGTAKPHTNGHVAYANGNGALGEDSPMSEDDSDDDVPLLVRRSFTLRVLLLALISLLYPEMCFSGLVPILSRQSRARNSEASPEAQGCDIHFFVQ